MKKAFALLFTSLFAINLLTGCSAPAKELPTVIKEKPKLLFYVGITMIKPMNDLVEKFMAENDCLITIVQGGSQDEYDSIKSSKQGDLYLPGSLSYRKKFLSEGFLLDYKFVGYNQSALVVAKGNPLNIPANLDVLTDKKYKVALCDPETGSIGDETKKVLEKYGNYKQAISNALFLTTDSRNITKSLGNGEIDVSLNWYATTLWDENKNRVDALPIDQKYAERKILVLNLLSTSKHPELTKKFMNDAASTEGRKVFQKYGFLTEGDLANFDKVIIE